ncbi:MAG: error-prone DNA polymerase [Pirellulales bacterium]
MRYAELQCKTNYSFLEGASHPHELVEQAVLLDYLALAVTDRNSLAGIVRAYSAARTTGLKLLIGCQLEFTDGVELVVWATDRAAYGRLARLLTVGKRRAAKGSCQLEWSDFAAHQAGLLAGLIPRRPPSAAERAATAQHNRHWAHRLHDLCGDRSYLLLQLHYGADDQAWIDYARKLGTASHLPLVAAGDVHYHVPQRMVVHDVLTAIRRGETVDAAEAHLRSNAERHLRPIDQLMKVYRSVPEALERTAEIADRCRFSMESLKYEYPEELAPPGFTPLEYLRQLTWEGARQRYPEGLPEKVRGLLEHELELIAQLQYEAFFLTVWDVVQYARRQRILCQGRGSAANSAVCYCLGITAVDPNQTDLLFERFVSRERNEAPDIDVDFEHERREEVLQYVYEKYGRDRAGLAAEVITYRLRSAVRDVGKALGWSWDCVDALAKHVEGRSNDESLADRCRQVGVDPDSPTGRRFLYVVDQILGFPRHLSQHVGGMVMTRGPLCELVPIENAAMADRTVICWDKDDLDELGILKVDCLALGMLTALRKGFDLIQSATGRQWTLASVPTEDPAVYEMICRADTMGVFQIESRAQMSMLPRLQPRCYYDLVVEVAIVRPGPIQGQMVHPYLRRRMGIEPVSYPNDAIRDVLHKTLGVPIFQEQAMRLAVVAAGFTPGEADQLRRAMGAWRKTGVIDQFRQKLVDGMQSRGLSAEFAEQVFRQIRGFGEYGFPESHAASFALLVYISAWMKHYYPAVFTAALINSQPMGFYAPSQLVQNLVRHGGSVDPIDVNHSNWDCTVAYDATNDNWRLRLGLRLVLGLGEEQGRKIERARRAGPFTSLDDLARRTKLPRDVLKRLAAADIFGSLGYQRREALWHALAQTGPKEQLPLFDLLSSEDDSTASLPASSAVEEVFADYQTVGLSLKAHPMQFYRDGLNQLNVLTAEQLDELADGAPVVTAGLVILRQRPGTAKGITFVTLEDETGSINLVIRLEVWEQHYRTARTSPAWIIRGDLQRRHGVTHVVVRTIEDLTSQLRQLKISSRDFR